LVFTGSRADGSNMEGDWVKEYGIRIELSVSTCTIRYENKYYMYCTMMGGVHLAISDDGLNFIDQGVVITHGYPGDPDFAGAHDPTVIELPNGSLRMFYSGNRQNYNGYERYISLCSAVSTDGINWVKEGMIMEPDLTDDGQMSVPDAVEFPNGELWIYYTFGFATENSLRAVVYNGPNLDYENLYNLNNWRRQDLNGFGKNSMDPDVIISSPSPLSLRLFFALGPEIPDDPKEMYGPEIYSATSSDGINWSVGAQPEIIATKPLEGVGVGDPDVISIGDDRYRMYYYGMPMPGGEPQDILSALSP